MEALCSSNPLRSFLLSYLQPILSFPSPALEHALPISTMPTLGSLPFCGILAAGFANMTYATFVTLQHGCGSVVDP